MDLALSTLGRFEIKAGTRTVPPFRTQKARALTAYLIARRSSDTSRERLLELFWPEFDEERARESLRTTLSTIRRSLREVQVDPAWVLFADKAVVRWSAATRVDAETFAALAQATDIASLQNAYALYRGDFLEGNYEDWVVAERERLARIYEGVLSRIVRNGVDVEAARKLIARNPYAEEAYTLLIEVEQRENRPAGAAELVSRYYQVIEDAGGTPSAEFESRFGPLFSRGDGAQLVIPFVARTMELQRLQHAFEPAAGGSLSLVVGEAGIGKTSILLRAAELARSRGLRAFLVSCARGEINGLAVWRGLFNRLTAKSLDEAVGGGGDIAENVATQVIAALPDACILFIDDAHELRGEALAALTHIIREAPSAGHVVVVSTRPEGTHVGSLFSGHGSQRMELGPLEKVDVRTALSRAMNSDAHDLADVLYERTGGHPLFLTALVESLVQKRALRREEGRWRVVRKLDEHLELPADLRASIETRLRAAGDDAAIVACALAIEPSASVDDISAALEYDERVVLDALDRLLGYSLVVEQRTTGTFRFTHDVVREVAASMLNVGRRASLHRAFARRFENSADAPSRLQLARHLRAAGMAGAAALAYLDAAQKAVEGYGFRDALEWSGDALVLLQQGDKRAGAIKQLAEVYRIRAYASAHGGELRNAVDAAEEAVRYARSCEQHLELAEALILRSCLKGIFGELDGQEIDAQEAAALALTAPTLAARAKTQEAAVARCRGRRSSAAALAVEGVSIAEAAGDPVGQYAAYEELLRTELGCWHFEDGLRYLSRSATLAERAGASAQARWCCMRAVYFDLMDQWHEAEEGLCAARHHFEVLPQRSDTAAVDVDYPLPFIDFVVHYVEARLAWAQGRWTDALEALRHCRRSEGVVNVPACHAAVDAIEIDSLLARRSNGDLELAARRLSSLPEGRPLTTILPSMQVPDVPRALFLAHSGDAKAERALRRALDGIEERAHLMPLDCDRSFARLAHAAQACGQDVIAERAAERSAFYRAGRMAAASACTRSAV